MYAFYHVFLGLQCCEERASCMHFIMFFWVFNVVKNVLHVCILSSMSGQLLYVLKMSNKLEFVLCYEMQMTVSGATAMICFNGLNMDGLRGTVIAAPLYRACTSNFGSICLGSLILSFVQVTLGLEVHIILIYTTVKPG